jgi:NAD(P)-dependent dehydrogenase (short-subunit alcohol dehydrogenase family)
MRRRGARATTPVAVVTGAARGIGAATERTLSAAGWAVVATDLDSPEPGLRYQLASKEDLEAVVESCANPSAVLPLVVDVRHQEDVDAAVAAAAVEHFGRLDAALAAGVIIGGMRIWETSDDEYDKLFDINTVGVWRLARAAVPRMLAMPQLRNGRFLAVVSAAAHRGAASARCLRGGQTRGPWTRSRTCGRSPGHRHYGERSESWLDRHRDVGRERTHLWTVKHGALRAVTPARALTASRGDCAHLGLARWTGKQRDHRGRDRRGCRATV